MTHVPLTLRWSTRVNAFTGTEVYVWAIWCAFRPGIVGIVPELSNGGELYTHRAVGEANDFHGGWEPLRRAAA